MAKKSTRTIRVITEAGRSTRVSLDNMDMKSNFKIKEWYTWTTNGGASSGNLVSLSTMPKSGAAAWVVGDNTIIGWGATGSSYRGVMWEPQLLDPNHIIVQDVYVNNAQGSNEISTIIVIETWSTSEDESILYMLKERSQGALE